MPLPPGPVFLLKELLWFSSRVVLAYVSFTVLDLPLSRAGNVILSLVIQPVVMVLEQLWDDFKMKRDAAARGAIVVPGVRQGSLSIVKDILKSFKLGYMGDVFHNWEQTYGSVYTIKIFSERRMITSEPIHMKAILATQFNEFVKGPLLFSQWNSLLGAGVFNADGDMWKFHRNMTRPFFSKDRIRDFEIFDHHALETIRLMKNRLAEGHPVEFQDAIARFTLDSATEFLFGKSVRSLDAGLPYPKSSGIANPTSFTNHPSNSFVSAFMKGQELTARRTRQGTTWPLQEFWNDEVADQRAVVNEFIEPILADVHQREKKEDGSECLLEDLVKYTQDNQVILDELVNILVAGRDTTAGLLTLAIYVLTQRPDIIQRLREEILKHVGPSSSPSYEDIKEMKYLRAFLNETLRLYPVVPFDARTSTAATTIPNPVAGGPPIFVPANTKVLYSVFLIHRREDLWGPDAHEFDPDRFIDERLHKYLAPNPFIFLPFNAGPRICLGQQFAYNEASFFLVRLLQSFSSFTFTEEAMQEGDRPPKEWFGAKGTQGRDKIVLQSHLTMNVKGGVWVKMK
ncbi:Protein kinase alk2 [Marasmius crinis-equi]|uniref:Protein kinase alk2 n=1 Tax=Marasmius crinis-equi TaxID=585013 RepID=A0ABR3FGM2_9AGAR